MFDRHMRKAKQQITDPTEIEEIIAKGKICRLAMCSKGKPYMVPMNYGYADGSLFFHCASEGLKIDILKENPYVCFEIEADVHLITTEDPCDWSQYYRSVIGFGKAQFIEGREEKREALLIMMNHYERRDWNLPAAKVDGVTMIRVEIDSMTAKRDGNQ